MKLPDRRILVGRTFPPIQCTINAEDVNDYIHLVAEDHPAFQSDEGARAAGYPRRVIPPSFAPFVALCLLRSFDWEKDFFVDYREGTIMSGEHELEWSRSLYVGETLRIESKVVDVSEKKGKKTFDTVRVRLTGVDETGAEAFKGAVTFILFK